MKIVQINSFSNGSTGHIMMNIHKELQKQGYDSYVVWGRGRKATNDHEIYMNDKIGVYFHALYSRLTGKTGFASKMATKRLLKQLDIIKPDIVHLHNVHGYYINIELLFNYLKQRKIKVIWTLHDCWAFTGQCPHFIINKCEKWKTECCNCPMINEYPKTIVDNSRWNFQKKKELFSGLDMTIVTPSKWLADIVKESFLKEYPIRVIHNGIDTSIFRPTEGDFRLKNNLENKKIVLGVAGTWSKTKGLNDFIELYNYLDNEYKIVLIGLNKSQINSLPTGMIGINRTENQKELAQIYSTSNVLFNPTYADNYPTVNIESIACGTPVLTYDTGGSGEFTSFLKSNNNNMYIIKKETVKTQGMNEVKKYIDKIISSNFEIKDYKYIDQETAVNNYINIYSKEK